jgi:hypothetical protein
MYRRCYRYEDMMPATAIRAERVNPFPAEVPKEKEIPVDVIEPEPSPIISTASRPEAAPSSIDPQQVFQSEETAEEQPLSFTQGIASSIKGIYENIRSQIIRDGKVLGILETDDLIILLLIVILIAEDCDDYVLLLGLAALIFLK